ncbi:MAG: phage tail family protein [Acholeplasmatales bacterium]|nr:phage tail family protein [Acholeplasmatales bacterium]
MQLILINKDNQQLDLLNNRDKFVLSSCEALHGIDTEVQEISSPYLDGTQIENVRALPRGISMTFKLIPDIKDSIEFFTNIVKSKQFVTLQETEKGNTITIQGVVKIPPYTRMMSMCEIQLDIYCGQPYWEDLNQVIADISMFIPMLYFPLPDGQYFTPEGRVFGVLDVEATKTFINDGDTSVGMNIKITAVDSVSYPCIICSSGNQYGWYMWLAMNIEQGDVIEINTVRGNKYIKVNGSTTYNGVPVLSLLHFNGEDWLQLETGENIFQVGSYYNEAVHPSRDLFFTITYKRRYE